jgi:hypothetical protein
MSTYTPIASLTLPSAQSSIVISNISQNYSDLIISVVHSNTTSSNADIIFRFNNDSNTNYSFTRVFSAEGAPATGSSDRQANISYIGGAWAPGTLSGSTNFATTYAQIADYSNTTTFKTMITSMDTASSQNKVAGKTVGVWRNTAAITSITIASASGNISANSTVNIYGIANASLTNIAKATGGDTITTDGTYWYHTFLSSGTFAPTQALTADYLVVAGGGGGGHESFATGTGGGGGAGGVRCTVGATGGGGSLESAISLSIQNYTVTVGAGGATSPLYSGNGAPGGNGSNSVFGSITSIGGGGGGGGSNSGNLSVGNGGSGGGGGGASQAGGTNTNNQGFAGGAQQSGSIPTAYNGGGGGGAAEAGNTDGLGQGGDGIQTSISGTATYYGGGGGGASYGVLGNLLVSEV